MAKAKPAQVLIRHGCSQRTPREYARLLCEQGMCVLMRAINATEDSSVPYRYSKADIATFEALGVELVALVERGTIVELPHVADEDFQRFMTAVTHS